MTEKHVSRRGFLKATAAGVAGIPLTHAEAETGRAPTIHSSKARVPAVLGGAPVRTGRFPSWPQIQEADERIWTQVLQEKAWCELSGGTQVAEFERRFQQRMGGGHVVAMANGTSSLHACLAALEVGPGDEVLVPPHTFVATIQPVLSLFALPVFVDIDVRTGLMDPGLIEEQTNSNTRAIIPVHLGGAAADMEGIMLSARKYSLAVLEDLCQAPLSEWGGKKLGLIGDCGAISFQVSKILPCGEGGAVVTTRDKLRTLVHAFRNNGRDPARRVGNYPYAGMNYRMTEFQGALLQTQLDRFDEWNRTRQENVDWLTRGLGELGGIQPNMTYPKNNYRGYYYWDVQYDREAFKGLPVDFFARAMQEEGIPIVHSVGRATLPESASIQRMLNSRGFRRIYSKEKIRQYKKSLRCPRTERYYQRRLTLGQQVLLGTRSDMETILSAVEKIKENSEAVRKALEERKTRAGVSRTAPDLG